jgi:hypothetical protein
MRVISARKRADPGDDWLGDLIRTKPLKIVALAPTNRMARQIRAMLNTGETWRVAQEHEFQTGSGLTEMARET